METQNLLKLDKFETINESNHFSFLENTTEVSKLIKVKYINFKKEYNMEKVAFITGANRGIGFETSKRLAETGVKVILGSRDLNKGKEAVKKLSNLGIEVDLVQYDAFDQDAPQKIYDYILEKYKKLDILINNAGVL